MMAKTGTYALIASATITTSTNTVTFSSIPQTYTDLVLVYNSLDTAINAGAIRMGNGSIDTGSNYSNTRMYGNSTTTGTVNGASLSDIYIGTTSTVLGIQIYHFLDYANTTTYKTVIGRASDTGYRTAAGVGMWRSTSAINTINLYGGTNWNGSSFYLYGIQAGNA